jgi:hypothetical protein
MEEDGEIVKALLKYHMNINRKIHCQILVQKKCRPKLSFSQRLIHSLNIKPNSVQSLQPLVSEKTRDLNFVVFDYYSLNDTNFN